MEHRAPPRQENPGPDASPPPAPPAPAALPVLLLVGLLIGPALALIAIRLATPFANDRLPPGTYALVAGGLVVDPLPEGPAGLQSGDAVTAIGGRPLAAWLAADVKRPTWRSGDTVIYAVIRPEGGHEVPITLGAYPVGAVLQREWGTMAFYTLFLVIAAYVFFRRPRLPAARALFVGAAAQFGALPWSLGLHVGDLAFPLRLGLYHAATIGSFMLAWIAYCHFALLFPRPLPLLRRRWLLPLLYGAPFAILGLYLLLTRQQAADDLQWMGRWGWITGPHAAAYTLLTLVIIVWQYRRSRGATRLQIRWLMLAAFLVGGAASFFYFLPPLLGGSALNANAIGLLGVLFPAAIAISILRYQLFDIDTLLNRALVYGLLTGAIAVVYVLVVTALGTLLGTNDNLLVALTATVVAAALFQPLRDRLQTGVNRLMFGDRAEPFEVLTRLGARLESTLTADMVYPTIVETVAQALKLPYAAVGVFRDGTVETVESYGRPTGETISFPLTYQGEAVGELIVARRAPDEAFSLPDQRILRNIARQAGAAVHAVRLLADLQESRLLLVTAREEERRRLRRDLHDGLGPQLASQTLTIDAIEKLLSRDPERARQLLQSLKAQSRDAIADIRRLVYNLRPPALDALGLVAALEELAAGQRDQGLAVTVALLSTPLPPLSAALEVAIFRVVQEAVTNVVRHAAAQTCVVLLRLTPGTLVVSITDDGQGLATGWQSGIGFQSMRERVAELGGEWRAEAHAGGGVCVTARFPLPAAPQPAGTESGAL